MDASCKYSLGKYFVNAFAASQLLIHGMLYALLNPIYTHCRMKRAKRAGYNVRLEEQVGAAAADPYSREMPATHIRARCIWEMVKPGRKR